MHKVLKQLISIIPPNQRGQYLFLVGLMGMSALLEMLGIGLLLPVIKFMQDPNFIRDNGFLSKLLNFIEGSNQQIIFIYMLLVLLIFFISKNIVLFMVARYEFNIISNFHKSLAIKMFSNYLYRPYTFHLEINTASLIRDVTTECANVLNQIMIPLAILMAELMVVAALFVLIVLIDPMVAFLTFILSGIVILTFFKSLRSQMSRVGHEMQVDSGKIVQYAQEGLGAIKEVKILGRELFFEKSFAKNVVKYTTNVKNIMVAGTIPRLVLDMLVVLIFISVLLVFIKLERVNDVLPIMMVYAAATFRLLPGINRIMGSLNAIKLGGASLNHVANSCIDDNTYKSGINVDHATEILKESIVFKDVSFGYQQGGEKVLKDISLQINKGEIIGFIGESGSGKTTLIDILLGLLPPSRGEVLIDGRDVWCNLSSWQRQIGYIPQSIYLTDDTLRRNIALGLFDEDVNEDSIWKSLEVAQLSSFVKKLPNGLDTIIGERGARLSGGQRQRIGIARAMYHNPEILILDEATSALDGDTEERIMKSIYRLRGLKTILIIAHRVSTLKICDRLYVIENGTSHIHNIAHFN